MKIIKSTFLLLLVTNTFFAQKKIEYIYPKAELNKSLVQELLDNTGTSSIKGTAMLKGKHVGYFMQVSLFPLTDYFLQYLELEKQLGTKGKKRASISPEVLSYRIITKVNGNDGSFEFTNLKPGKYYIEGYLNVVKEKKSAYYVGQNSTTFEGSYISGPPIFQEFSYNKINGYYISGTAEIANDGEVATTIIKN
ncbi:hypothetical protein [Mariniflexile sp.]|uniref:hypothetical protein n=1 Tax=Mariniflexile sp. TaxID=1979402 RepID=UPI0040480C83